MYDFLFLDENYNSHVDNRRVSMARQHCIVPRLVSHAVLQITRVYMTKKKKKRTTFLESSQAVKKSLWSVSVCVRSSSHTPVCFTPEATGKLTGEKRRRRRRRERGSGWPSISPAQSALSGLAVTAGGQVRSSPNLSLSLLMSLFLLHFSCQYL